MEAQQNVTTRGVAGIVFQPLATGDFQQFVDDMQEILSGTGSEMGSTVETKDHAFGSRWMILRDPDLEDIVVGVNAVSDALAVGGYNDRVLAAVFAFQDVKARSIYLIYNYKRGTWYPFVPAPGDKQRDNERELQLKAATGP